MIESRNFRETGLQIHSEVDSDFKLQLRLYKKKRIVGNCAPLIILFRVQKQNVQGL